jgi:hypothetical protein
MKITLDGSDWEVVSQYLLDFQKAFARAASESNKQEFRQLQLLCFYLHWH